MNRRHFCLILRLNDDDFTKSGRFIRFNLISDILNNTLKFNLTGSFRDNNGIERVPLSNQLTLFNHIAIRYIQCRTVRNVMSRQNNISVYIHKTYFSQTTYHHFRRFAHLINNVNRAELIEFQTSGIFSYNARISCNIGGCTTGMERTQCQLCTRLTNWLGSDYTDSFTFLNHAARCKVTSITFSTYTFLRFTSQHWTDFNTFDRRFLNLLSDIFCNLISTGNQ